MSTDIQTQVVAMHGSGESLTLGQFKESGEHIFPLSGQTGKIFCFQLNIAESQVHSILFTVLVKEACDTSQIYKKNSLTLFPIFVFLRFQSSASIVNC